MNHFDVSRIDEDFDDMLGLFRTFLHGAGSHAGLREAFQAFLHTPYHERAHQLVGLERKLELFKLATQAVGQEATDEERRDFGRAFTASMAGGGVRDRHLVRLNSLFSLRCEWFVPAPRDALAL